MTSLPTVVLYLFFSNNIMTGMTAGAVNLAAVPNPINFSPERIFSNNMMSSYNVMEAASKLGIKRVVTGSRESAYGFCWAKHLFAPNYLPVD
jgi:nucleoside-diphosphate-sugar epimerase